MTEKKKSSRENGYYGPTREDLTTGGVIALSLLIGVVAGIVWFSTVMAHPTVHSIAGGVMAICVVALVLSIVDNLL